MSPDLPKGAVLIIELENIIQKSANLVSSDHTANLFCASVYDRAQNRVSKDETGDLRTQT